MGIQIAVFESVGFLVRRLLCVFCFGIYFLGASAWANSETGQAELPGRVGQPGGGSHKEPNSKQVNPIAPVVTRHYVNDYPPVSAGMLNVVVEIPAGTNQKWEVDKATGALALEEISGKPRVVAYLGYPGNYGMVPQTILPKASGGDGDPLDVLLIGLPVAQGEVAKGKLIGVLKFLDRGEQDDKLLAVVPGSALGKVESIEQLRRDFPGVALIVKTWFENYKGASKMKFIGFGSRSDAAVILEDATKAYKAVHSGVRK